MAQAGTLPGRRELLLGLAAAALSPRYVQADPDTRKADRLIVLKSRRLLFLARDDNLLTVYRVSLGGHPIGPKRRAGDGRTPEGLYVIDGRNPNSRYHLSLHISYPNDRDQAHARAIGARPGGDICLHGLPEAYSAFTPVAFLRDWTDGCIALANSAIEEIWDRVDDGTPIEIRA
jgi:murein L,D-transpeptidase YafK